MLVKKSKNVNTKSKNLPFDRKVDNIRIAFDKAIKDINPSAANSLKNCANYYAKSTYENINTLDIIERFHSQYCKSRFCMICAKNKQLRMLARWLPAMDALAKDKNLDFLFITLTVPNPKLPKLRLMLDRMNKAFNYLYDQYLEPRGFKGCIRSVEYLGDETPLGFSHPHYHIIACIDKTIYFKKIINAGSVIEPNLINKDFLRDKWCRSLNMGLKNTTKLEFIEKIHGVEIGKIKSKSGFSSPVAGLLETLKYCAKGTSLEKLPDVAKKELYKQTKGTRLFSANGIFRTILKDLDIEDKPLSNEWQLILIEWFKFNGIDSYKLVKQDSSIHNADYMYKSGVV